MPSGRLNVMLVPMGSSDGFLEGRLAGILSALQSGSNRVRRGVRPGHVSRCSSSNKKPPQGPFQICVTGTRDQCASAQTLFLVKYISPAKMIRKTNTCRPRRLRASICGSAVHVRKVVTSLEYCATVAGDPSSKVTWPSESGGGILMAWPGKYLL